MSRHINKGNYWPTPEQECLLKTALLSESCEVLEAWTQWQAMADIDHLDLGSFNLLPLVCHNLTLHGIQDNLTGKLQGMKRRAWYKNQMLFHTVMPVIHVLHKAGIKVMLLKGAALLAKEYYPSLGLRPMSDIDILVPASAAVVATKAILNEGWTFKQNTKLSRYKAVDPEFLRYCFKGVEFKHPSGYEFDLHWQIPLGATPMAEDFWSRAKLLEFRGVQIWALDDVDQLFHICTHGLAWNDVPPLRWVADVMMILDHTNALDWNALLLYAQRSQLILPLRLGLGYLQKLLNAPINPGVLSALQYTPASPLEHLHYWGRTHHRRFFRVSMPPLALHQSSYRDYCRTRKTASESEESTPSFLYFLQKIWGLDHGGQVISYASSRLIYHAFRH
jgi:Uncharacterised nucleotidyltransferase